MNVPGASSPFLPAFADLLVTLSGAFNLAIAVFHLTFWRLFDWRRDLASLTAINRSVMQILNLCLTFVFLVMAYVLLVHRSEMLATPLGVTLLFAFALFWLLRAIEQVVFFGLRHPASLGFMLVFLVGIVLHATPAFIAWLA